MLTWIRPAFAVANCVKVHSAQLGAQMPTRSPGTRPSASSPAARRSTRRPNSAKVQRIPCSHETSASTSGQRAIARSSTAPMVSSISAGAVSPHTWLVGYCIAISMRRRTRAVSARPNASYRQSPWLRRLLNTRRVRQQSAPWNWQVPWQTRPKVARPTRLQPSVHRCRFQR